MELPEGSFQPGRYLWHLMGYFIEFASSLPSHADCWDVIDRKSVLGIMGTGGGYFFKDQDASRLGVCLLHSLIWTNGADAPAPITCRV